MDQTRVSTNTDDLSSSFLSRRKFLRFGTGLFLCGGATVAAHHTSDPLQEMKQSSRALGTTVSLTVLHSDIRAAEEAIDAALAELERVERLMSIYRNDSQLSVLNRHGELNDPDPLFVTIMRNAMEWSRRSDGAFDITVQPLWELFQRAKQNGTVPDSTAIQVARKKVDWRQIEISASSIHFRQNGMGVTLNGIAQGYTKRNCSGFCNRPCAPCVDGTRR